MDKNSNIGFVLILLIMVFFWWLNKPSEAERARLQKYYDSIAVVEQQKKDALAAANQSNLQDSTLTAEARDSINNARYGLLAPAVEGNEVVKTLQNGLVKVDFSNKGGKIKNVELINYSTFDENPLRMYADNENTKFGFPFIHNNRSYNTNELYFVASEASMDSDSTQSIKYVLAVGNGNLTYTYTLAKNSYEVALTIEGSGLDGKIITPTYDIQMEWNADMPAQEKSHKNEGMWSSLCFRYADADVEQMEAAGNDSKNINMKLDWVAYKNQFFSSIFYAKDGFAGGSLKSDAYAPEAENIKKLTSTLGIKFDFRTTSKADFVFYFLPNYFYTLDSYQGMQFTDVLPLGWGIFGWVNEWIIIPLFKYLEMAFSNYGVIILLLTIIIKLLIFPFTFSSFKSQAKMRVLKPQIDAINEKIPAEKALERQQATMELYKKAGVSPMGGCLPMLLQMPILFAAFRFFPAAIELRGESFLWASDLSAYDSVLNLPFSIPFYGDHVSLFCLLMCVTQVLYTKFTMQGQNTAQMPGMSVMMYMMPVMLLFFFNDYASGLCLYYFFSSLITILMTIVIKKFFIDENAILAQIEANKKKPLKKSRFAEMYERKLKEMEKAQRDASRK